MFSKHVTKEGEPGIQNHVTNVDKWHCATLPAKRGFQTHLASKTWLSEAYRDHSTLSDTHVAFLLTHIEPEGSPTRNFHDPSRFLPLNMGVRHSRDFGSQAPQRPMSHT